MTKPLACQCWKLEHITMWKQWLKNSSSNRSVQRLCISQSLAGWLISAQCKTNDKAFGLSMLKIRTYNHVKTVTGYLAHLCQVDSSITSLDWSISNSRVSGYFLLLLCFIEILVFNINSVDPDMGLHCLPIKVNILKFWTLYSILFWPNVYS